MDTAIGKLVLGHNQEKDQEKRQVNIRLSEWDIAALDLMAKHLGTSRSGFTADLVEAAIVDAVRLLEDSEAYPNLGQDISYYLDSRERQEERERRLEQPLGVVEK